MTAIAVSELHVWQELLSRITYRHGVTLSVRPSATTDQLTFQVEVDTADTRDGSHIPRPIKIVHRTLIPPGVDEKYRIAFVRQCVQKMEIHESDEWLKLDGKMIYDPHSGDFHSWP